MPRGSVSIEAVERTEAASQGIAVAMVPDKEAVFEEYILPELRRSGSTFKSTVGTVSEGEPTQLCFPSSKICHLARAVPCTPDQADCDNLRLYSAVALERRRAQSLCD